MTEVRPQDVGEAPTIEVRIYRHGELIHGELCESEEEAALVVHEWDDVEDVEWEVDALSPHHPSPEPVEHEPADSPWDDYPRINEPHSEPSS